MTNALPMPADLHKAADPAKEYARLDKDGQSAYMKRVDLMYPLYLEEIKRGQQDWTGRVAVRLGIDGEEKSSKAVVSSGVSIFKTFRLPAPLGLGYARADLERTPLNRLRAIAGNHKWAMENPQRVAELVSPDLQTTEYEIISEIKGKTGENPDAVKFETISFRFTVEDVKMIRDALKAVSIRMDERGETPYTSQDGGLLEGKPLDAKALALIVSEWLGIEEPFDKANNEYVQNAIFMPDTHKTWAEGNEQAEEADDGGSENAAD